MDAVGSIDDSPEVGHGGLRAVTYVSSATDKLTSAELLTLLERIRPHNEELGLSGMLLYSGGNIIQVLEGPPAAVEETLALIRRDPRHRDIIVLLDDDIEHRAFPEWTMGFRDVGPRTDADRSIERDATGVNDVMAGGPVREGLVGSDPPDTVRLLELFRRNMR